MQTLKRVGSLRHRYLPQGSLNSPVRIMSRSSAMPTRYWDELETFLTGVQPPLASERTLATVLFTDIVESTEMAAEIGDRRWRDLLEAHHALVRKHLGRFDGHEVDTAGDGFLAVFDGPARAIRCARDIIRDLQAIDLQLRAGVHTGECEVVDGKVAGIAVSIGARVASLAKPGQILVSGTVKDLVAGSGIRFRNEGRRGLKGIPGEWLIFSVE